MYEASSQSTVPKVQIFHLRKTEPTKPRNILFISIDDLRPKIHSYGELEMITPNIDQLAAQGVQFDNAYTNIAVCGASRASIMTGIRPSQERFNDFSTRGSVDAPNAIALNQIFKNNGYETISYGKIYHHKDDFVEGWTETDGGALMEFDEADQEPATEQASSLDALQATSLTQAFNECHL